MPVYQPPADLRATRDRALELAVRSVAGQAKHMTEIAARAHYFAHYLTDPTRNEICDSIQCPYQVVLVPHRPADAG